MRIKKLQEKRSLFVSVIVFFEKNLSTTKISLFWPESAGFLRKKILATLKEKILAERKFGGFGRFV